MIGIIKLLLLICTGVFLLSWFLSFYQVTRAISKIVYGIGSSIQLVMIVLLIRAKSPLWTDNPLWFLLIAYFFVFNALVMIFVWKTDRIHRILHWANIASTVVSFMYMPNAYFFEVPQTTMIWVVHYYLGALTFGAVAFQLYMIIINQDVIKSIGKRLNLAALVFWIAKIIVYSLWSKYAWGMYWYWEPYTTQFVIVFLLLSLSSIWVSGYETKKEYWINCFILSLILFVMLFPVSIFVHRGGYGG
jgi:hypothetical protein